MYKNIKIISFFILFFYIIALSYFQSLSQHWSAYFDMDVWVIYDSSLIASGYEQYFRDHPAFTLFYFNALIFKIVAFFNSGFVFKIEDIINSENSEQVLENLFMLLRFVNSLLAVLLLYTLYKILRVFEINKLQSFLALLIISFSHTFYQNLFELRTEILSLLTFLISFYFLLIFFKKKKSLVNLLFAGIFFSLSMLTSIKIIFIFILIFLIIPILDKLFAKANNDLLILNNNKMFSFCVIFNIIIIFTYICLQLFYINNHPRFELNKGIDLKIFTFLSFIYVLYLFTLSKFRFFEFKRFFCIFSFYLIGYCLGVFLFIFLDLLDLTQINFAVFGRLTNTFYYMSIYSSQLESSIGINFFVKTINVFFSDFRFDKILFLSLLPILIFSLWIDYKNLNNKLILLKIILFFCMFFNILIFNLRYFLLYEIIIYPIYLVLLLISLKSFSTKYANIFLYLIVLYTFSATFRPNPINSINNFNGMKDYFNRTSLLSSSCNKDILIDGWEYHVPRLDINFFNRLCQVYKN